LKYWKNNEQKHLFWHVEHHIWWLLSLFLFFTCLAFVVLERTLPSGTPSCLNKGFQMNRDESLRLEIYDDWFVIDLVTFNIRLLLLPSEYTKKNVKFKTSLIRAYNGTWFDFVAERFHGETWLRYQNGSLRFGWEACGRFSNTIFTPVTFPL